MTPGPFELAQGVGNRFSKGIRAANDQTALDQILQEASQAEDPNQMDKIIGQLISRVSPEKQQMAMQVIKMKTDQLNQGRQQKADVAMGLPENFAQGSKEGREAYIQANKPVKPVGGLSGQPVPPETGKAIQQVITKNKESSADELAIAMDAEGIPRAYSNSYIENRRRMDEANTKTNVEKIKQDRKEQLKFHDESKDYDETLTDTAVKSQRQMESLKQISSALESGNVSPLSISNIFSAFGERGKKFSDAFINQDQAKILANIPNLLEGWKAVFGVRLSDADLRLLEGKLPSIGKSLEANQAIVSVMKKYSKMAEVKADIGEKIKAANGGLRPLGYSGKVEARFKELNEPVKVINPRNGRVIEIPAYEVSAALNAGAKLASE